MTLLLAKGDPIAAVRFRDDCVQPDFVDNQPVFFDGERRVDDAFIETKYGESGLAFAVGDVADRLTI